MGEQTVKVNIQTPAGPKPAWAIAMTVSQAEQDRQNAMRKQSYELAIQRCHVKQ